MVLEKDHINFIILFKTKGEEQNTVLDANHQLLKFSISFIFPFKN